MPRKRIEMGPVVEDQIRALMARGGTVESITAALRAGAFPAASPATIARRMAEMRGGVNKARVARREAAGAPSPLPSPSEPPESEPELPARPEDIPEGTGLETYDRWLERAERMAVDAETDGDLKAIGNAGRLVGFLLEAKRKATPVKVADPNDAPDMVALGKQTEERFLRMIDLVLEDEI